MALAARRFTEPALDVRWHTIWSFMPIIACLPADLWTLKDGPVTKGSQGRIKNCGMLSGPQPSVRQSHTFTQVLRRAIVPTDMTRYLDQYARRIHRFAPGLGRQIYVSSQVLQAMQVATDFKPGVLAPLLSAFQITWMKPESVQLYASEENASGIGSYMWLFLPPGLKTLNFSASSSNALYLSSIQLTPTRLPNLTSLNIGIGYKCLETDFVTEYLTSSTWDQLKDLHIYATCSDNLPYLDVSAIQHLASLPRLTKLRLDDLTEVPSPHQFHEGMGNGRACTARFASLAELVLSSLYCSDLVAFLNYLPPKVALTSLLCNALSEEEETLADQEAQRVIDAVHERCNPGTLQSLSLEVNEYGGEEEETVDLDEDAGLDIQPLLDFNKLTSLKFLINGRYRLAPETIERISEAWPNMETLDLRSTFCTTQIPRIDHSHILLLARKLPSLETLGIRFDATKITGSERGVGAPFPLKHLYVGDSPISSPSRVLSFLRGNFSLKPCRPYMNGRTGRFLCAGVDGKWCRDLGHLEQNV
ncbi:hypothetical protein NMY22_g14661 [Coprinellus aureogranulatus]|nr:hypothetical protein NMY22_g14661 [Coprinellus aureogranulatus]